MAVLGIMLLHGLPVFLIGVFMDDEFALMVAAIISGLIGIFTGSPEYIMADIFAVFLAVAMGKSIIRSS